MNEGANTLEALRLVSDWAKWLVTIDTAALALLGSLFTSDKVSIPVRSKVLGTLAIVCFIISIVAAAVLLLTLPEIAQTLKPQTNIWMTKDSVVGYVFGLKTQSLALIESLFFGFGVILSSSVILTVVWPRKNKDLI